MKGVRTFPIVFFPPLRACFSVINFESRSGLDSISCAFSLVRPFHAASLCHGFTSSHDNTATAFCDVSDDP